MQQSSQKRMPPLRAEQHADPRRQMDTDTRLAPRDSHGLTWSPRIVLALQRLHGNGAVTRLLAQNASTSLQRRPAQHHSPVTESTLAVTSPFVGSPPTLSNWGGGMLCKAPAFTLSGSVIVPENKADGDLTLGFMQALVGCTGPKGRYWDTDDNPYMTSFAPYASLPMRDGESNAGGVFYGPEAQTVVNATSVSVSMGDQPQTSLAWKTPDGKGTLQQIVGEHQFVTWLVVQSDATREIYPLHWISWRVGWFAAVDQSLPMGIPFEVGMVTGFGEGQGPLAPIRTGSVANAGGQPTQWEAWSG